MKLKPKPLQEYLIYEKGMISAWEHIRTICNLCVKAHKEEIKRFCIKAHKEEIKRLKSREKI